MAPNASHEDVMRNRTRTLTPSALLAVALLPLIAAGGAAQNKLGRADLLVTSDWLATQRQNPKLVLLHVGQKEEYDAGHIPGARYLQLRDISTPMTRDTTVLALEMPAVDDLRQRLERLGISDDSRIVIYYGNDWVSPSTRALLALQGKHFATGFDLPHAHSVAVACCQAFAVRAECHPLDMDFQAVDGAEVVAGCHIPEPQRVVVARRGEHFAIGAERQVIDSAIVTLEREAEFC